MERIPGAQPPLYAPKRAPAEVADVDGMDFPIYVYKPRRGVKRGDDCKETYKLPHRLIEKKRRDRINESIAQLKELLPEPLKLATLGHLEKAVVLELTLKHVRTLSAALEQQQQEIAALQTDTRTGPPAAAGGDMFRCGFQLCATELLQYLDSRGGGAELTPSHVISHIQKVAAQVLRPPGCAAETARAGPAQNCVPVIQRTHPAGGGRAERQRHGHGQRLRRRARQAQGAVGGEPPEGGGRAPGQEVPLGLPGGGTGGCPRSSGGVRGPLPAPALPAPPPLPAAHRRGLPAPAGEGLVLGGRASAVPGHGQGGGPRPRGSPPRTPRGSTQRCPGPSWTRTEPVAHTGPLRDRTEPGPVPEPDRQQDRPGPPGPAAPPPPAGGSGQGGYTFTSGGLTPPTARV